MWSFPSSSNLLPSLLLSLLLFLASYLPASLSLSLSRPHPPSLPFDNVFLNLVKRQAIPSTANHSSFSNYYQSLAPSSSNAIRLADQPRSFVNNNSLSSGQGDFDHAHEELFKIVTEVSNTHLALSLLPAFIVLFGSFSAFVKEKLYIGEAIIAVLFGVILGPYASGVFDPRSWNQGLHFDDLTLEFTRIVIALSVFAVGVELPKAYVLRHWRSLACLLGPAMLAGWLISGALIYLLIPALNFLEALVVAAAVTPTDPILAASVVGKGKYAQKHVPAHLRHLLQAESGCNDGAAFPFLYLAMFLLLRGEVSVGKAIGNWFLLVILYQILLGTVIGAVIGIIARKTLKFCKRRAMIDRESMVAMYVALALLTTGVTTLAGSDDLLAAFSCGAAFAWDDWFTESIEASNFSAILDLLINCATFIYVGATIPFASWNDSNLTLVPWRLVVLGFSILILRRLPVLLMLQKLIPDIKTHREAVFSGHFGPIGVGAIFISTLATAKLPTPQIPPRSSLDVLALTAQPIIYLLVLFSILAHGLSIPFFTLGRNVHSRVHTMTRTWTQASGNEPSWLSRVKRVDRINDESVGDLKNEAQPLSDPVPVSPTDSNNHIEQSQRQNSDDQVTQVGEETAANLQEKTPEPSVASEEISALPPRRNSNASDRQDPENDAPAPPLVRGHTEPALGASPPMRRLGSRVGILRLGSGLKRTPEEQAAHQREKLLRDEWCRRERLDIVKKDEERIYKSGRHIVIERGDGDEVEVRDLDTEPNRAPRGQRDHHKSSHLSLLKGRHALAMNEREGIVPRLNATRTFEAAKHLVHRGLNKHRPTGTKKSSSKEMPGPGEGPHRLNETGPSGTGTSGAPNDSFFPIMETVGGDEANDEVVWIEGDNLVIERNHGEDVRVEPRRPAELRARKSLPAVLSGRLLDPHPVAQSSSSLPNPTLVEEKEQAPGDAEDQRKERSAEVEVAGQGEDEWEEDEDEGSERGGGREGFSRARSASRRRRPSSRGLRRSRRLPGTGIRSLSASGNHRVGEFPGPRGDAEENVPARPLRNVEFADEMGSQRHLRVSTQVSSRSSSPSRSIRFAEHPERPTRGSSGMRKKGRKTSRMGLLGLVSSTRESSRRSSLLEQTTESDEPGKGPGGAEDEASGSGSKAE